MKCGDDDIRDASAGSDIIDPILVIGKEELVSFTKTVVIEDRAHHIYKSTRRSITLSYAMVRTNVEVIF